jgi:hypothetical protein
MKGLSFATVAFCLSTGYLISEPADNGNTRGASDERGAASNATLKQSHDTTKRLGLSKPKEIFLAVHRRDFMVYYRRIDAEEYRCSARSVTGSRSPRQSAAHLKTVPRRLRNSGRSSKNG